MRVLLLALVDLALGGPCDIYGNAGNACVAAHSVVRALYTKYDGPLYRVQRKSDGTAVDISVLEAGGFANAAAQDVFCGSSTCTIELIYDQSPRGNHLSKAPWGSARWHGDKGVIAGTNHFVVKGHRVYAAVFEPGMGYRNDKTSGMATGDVPETMYMVTSGKYFNSGCCFDYGNAETTNIDNGAGTMEAIYFGGRGNKPHVKADLEEGLWGGNESSNPANIPLPFDFVTAMVKGKPHGFALKGGNAQNDSLITLYEGARPKKSITKVPCGFDFWKGKNCHYDPMKKQGAIVLGIGGDNTANARGVFFEGIIASGYSSDAADKAVQADIAAAGYTTADTREWINTARTTMTIV